MGFYSPLLAMLDHAVEERFLKPENRALVLGRDQPVELLRALEEWRPAHIEKWLDRICPRGSGQKYKRCCGGAKVGVALPCPLC
jgi:hypothetical protein